MTIPPERRAAVALVALVSAAFLFHAQVASALVTRGDDRLRTGDIDGAVGAYDRAMRLDPVSRTAADRLAFSLLMRHGDSDAARSYAIASAALQHAPRDANLLVDRALAAQRLRRWKSAARDFALAAAVAHDSRFARLAERLANRGAGA
ncbi:hypothetical protein WPS_16660 [Vulcanimicrobium alpinum]|uniref:Tetratricopeptide repeat protein n=1 Tax=Vulcanimicrobium alpinum TaxID=3016050 RepID=A0AAN2C9C3_UNVUL|nr:hypothetical protein [Vulcanimicrobium alpinum]BDE06390.1 hypothetical protein WPS_16660 [Vulcanimicrobium alpinum]